MSNPTYHLGGDSIAAALAAIQHARRCLEQASVAPDGNIEFYKASLALITPECLLQTMASRLTLEVVLCE